MERIDMWRTSATSAGLDDGCILRKSAKGCSRNSEVYSGRTIIWQEFLLCEIEFFFCLSNGCFVDFCLLDRVFHRENRFPCCVYEDVVFYGSICMSNYHLQNWYKYTCVAVVCPSGSAGQSVIQNEMVFSVIGG